MEAQEAANAPRIRTEKNIPLPTFMDLSLSLCLLQRLIIFYFPLGGLSNGESGMGGFNKFPFDHSSFLPPFTLGILFSSSRDPSSRPGPKGGVREKHRSGTRRYSETPAHLRKRRRVQRAPGRAPLQGTRPNGAPRSSARPFHGNPSALWFLRATRLGSGLGMPQTSPWLWPTWRKVKGGKIHHWIDSPGKGDTIREAKILFVKFRIRS